MSLFIGLMSGTSMDGIDAALVDVSTHTLIAGITRPYSAEVHVFLRAVLSGQRSSLADICQLNTLIGHEFALAANQVLDKATVQPKDVVAIGSHGQTVCHDAAAAIPYTLQLGCGYTIAEQTGIQVVADFRTKDLVLGGQGAPFAPIYHQALFSDLKKSVAIVNIGGIANVSYLDEAGHVEGYDVGPGNCLMDAWSQMHLGQAYDKNGHWAASGEVITPLLNSLFADSYFKLAVPKSIGKEYFSMSWLNEHLHADYAPKDVQATLLALTTISISTAIAHSVTHPQSLYICGGGVHNDALLHGLKRQLPGLSVESTQRVGVDPDFLEAMMFAWLASQRLNQMPLDLRLITGARRPSMLGVVYL